VLVVGFLGGSDYLDGFPVFSLHLCLTRPWGFDIAEIRVPTRVIYGLTDVLAPRQHGKWLARNVPNAEAVVEEHGGHMLDPDQMTERYGWLVQPV
jgi:pimeloyl-ACP methyl ester carboxylesterase